MAGAGLGVRGVGDGVGIPDRNCDGRLFIALDYINAGGGDLDETRASHMLFGFNETMLRKLTKYSFELIWGYVRECELFDVVPSSSSVVAYVINSFENVASELTVGSHAVTYANQ